MPRFLKHTLVRISALAFLLCFLLALPGQAQNSLAWTADDFVDLSQSPAPEVAYALRRDGQTFYVALEVASLAPTGNDTTAQVGLAAEKSLVLNSAEAKSVRVGSTIRYDWVVPFAKLIAAPTDWTKLRMAVAVAWKGGPNGTDRERERFGHINSGAAHQGLASDVSQWIPLSLNEYALVVAERKNQLALTFSQPLEGKATIVVEDDKGRRVRNFISGRPMQKGPKRLVWDGLDDDGRVAPPGNYRWRAISHAGLKPRHLLTFADGPGSNHGILHTAATNGTLTFLGTSVSEGGHDIVAFDGQGNMKAGYEPPLGMGLRHAELASDEKYIYLMKDGRGWGQKVDTTKPDWKTTHNVTLVRLEIDGGRVAEYAGQRFVTLTSQEVGPGSASKRDPEDNAADVNLAGLALLGGKLYLSSRASEAILVFDATTAQRVGEIRLPAPGSLTVAGNALLAVSGRSVARVEASTGQISPLIAAGEIDPQGLTTDKAGQIYISDGKSHTVRVFDSTGKPLRTLGKPGGAYNGTYDEQRLVNPRGLVVAPNGWLWVTEERGLPKRYAAYDAQTGAVKRDYWGRTAYAAPGSGMDSRDQTRWVGMDALWKLDLEKKTARPTSILGTLAATINATHHRFVHLGERTFLVSQAKVTFVAELQKDGSAKNLAFCGPVSLYAHDYNWTLPRPFLEAFKNAYPGLKDGVRTQGISALWVDKSGDGQMQVEEFEFSKHATSFAGGYWGHDARDLTLRYPAAVGGKNVLVTLAPQGFYPGGAPKYPDLKSAILAAPALESPDASRFRPQVESTIDRRGNVLFNSDPKMTAFSPDGKLLWTYPNRWSGVHGSHKAPLPQIGELQGALFFTGIAPLDKESDVFVMNGNHGRLFALTSDGLYLDEMFEDVRLGRGRIESVYMAGGEIFGGFFEKSAADGRYYLQVGGNEYRVFQVDGLDTVKRSSGTFTISPAQAAASESALKRRLAAQSATKDAVAPVLAAPPTIDGNEREWPAESQIKWDKNGQFPVVARVGLDAQNLYLHYAVTDDSPWFNNGKDWQLLFKTGDSIDLQLGTDTGANPRRSGPVPGDLRLLIAPLEGKEIAVLYRHRVPGTNAPVAFTSPWRAENVDEVKRLGGAKIAVLKEANRYRVEAAIPLAELGWKPAPGQNLRADFGAIYSDTSGKVNVFRNYWSNQATALVSDVPGEIMLSPNLWGTLRIGGAEVTP